MKTLSIVSVLGIASLSFAAHAQPDVNVSVGGVIKPGVYGRVEIGNRPPPPVIYPQPVVIVAPPPVAVAPQPIYMHVPPGHAKKWRKHCHKYNACGQPVYFVKTPEGFDDHHHGKGRGRGRGHGKHDD